jgi:protein phosphatase
VLGVLLALVLAGVFATWAYIRSQYFVGIDAGHVVVFRGVKGDVAGVDLHGVSERSTLTTQRLTDVEREALEDGIVANDAADARAIVQRLIEVACPTPVAAPSATPTPTASPSAPVVPRPTPTPCP